MTYRNPMGIAIADPFVLYHEGTYYLYGTSAVNTGFIAYASKDLVNWQRYGLVLEKTEDSWSQSNFWSPEVVPVKGEFHMYYNASSNEDSEGRPRRLRLCVAKGTSPLGPFTELKAPIYDPDGDGFIDPHVFVDDDGRAYVYFTRVTIGRNEIQVVRLKENMVDFDGEPVLCVRPTEPWESHPWRGGHVVAEGAHVLKHKGLYYLTYSANHYLDPNYCIGYAVSENPLGPWKKYEGNPILKRTDHIYGPGNGMAVASPDGKERFIVYHVHNNLSEVHPRRLAIDRIRFVPSEDGPDTIEIAGPTHTAQQLPSGAEK